MKIKVSEATGMVLDWMAAKADGRDSDCEVHGGNVWYGRTTSGFVVWSPSTNWSQGGPIIDREEIATRPTRFGWEAVTEQDDYYSVCRLFGHTPLIAAMRCYVASKLGNEVEVPEELLK